MTAAVTNRVRNISYDFVHHRGTLLQDDGQLCEMADTVELFARIDPEVESMSVVVGRRSDAGFTKIEGHWVRVR
jgi:hypothetical protein